jgi:hypothetical protein
MPSSPSILLLALAQLTLQPAPPRPPAEIEVQRTGEAYGECLGAASLRLSASSDAVEAIVEASFRACSDAHAVAVRAYRAYLESIGMSVSPEQVEQIFAEGRGQVESRLAGCVAEARSRRDGNPRQVC